MPKKKIYYDSINNLEKDMGFSFIDKEQVAKRLQEAWKKDTTPEKFDYLKEYREVFRNVLTTWSEHELSKAFHTRSEKMPDFKKCLLKTDKALKMSALALIPALRDNEEVVFHMTFGFIDPRKLQEEFMPLSRKYLTHRAAEDAAKKRKSEAYDKHKKDFLTATTRKIADLVRDKDALQAMSFDEKIDFALALEAHRNDKNRAIPLSQTEEALIDEALGLWKKEIGCARDEELDDFVAGKYFVYAQKLGTNEWIEEEVNNAISEYNKTPNAIKQEIAEYKQQESALQEKEHSVRNEGVTDESAEMVGELFAADDLKHEIDARATTKERLFFEQKVAQFNKTYSQRVNSDSVYGYVKELGSLMIKAREEKERFLSKDSVVVIENGKEICYNAKDYFKETIQEANKKYLEKITKIEEQLLQADKVRERAVEEMANLENVLTAKQLEESKLAAEKTYKDKMAEIEKSRAEAKKELEQDLSATEGGIVIEKNGQTTKRHKASRYYETHETKKEQYAYGEYQKIYARLYKDAAISLKEKNYKKGKVTNFSVIAKDVDMMLKSAMFISNVYDNEKNREVLQKCNFGGFSAEKLAAIVSDIPGDSWAINQSSEAAWNKQVAVAQEIFSGWKETWTKNPKITPANMVAETLNKRREMFSKYEISKKEMLDYAIAAETHLNQTFPAGAKRFFSFLQYRRERNALLECRKALGLGEHDSLRVAMNNEYDRMSKYMSKEEAYTSIGQKIYSTPGFQEEKKELEREHQIVKDEVIAKKTAELEEWKAKGKEPTTIHELDEREKILNEKPRVKPIPKPQQLQQNLNLNSAK